MVWKTLFIIIGEPSHDICNRFDPEITVKVTIQTYCHVLRMGSVTVIRRGFGLVTGFIRHGDLQLQHRLQLW
jgi:hypothetical protein